MLRMNGVEAWISGDDKKAFPVYSVQKEASTGVVTCWIPFEPGRVSRRFHSLASNRRLIDLRGTWFCFLFPIARHFGICTPPRDLTDIY
jgi:hypothetical protein